MSKINPQPKKLTLQQALDATKKPLTRWGDLIQVSDFTRFINGTLMRATFLPDQPNLMTCETRKFEKNFNQPATEKHLCELYAAGGWIESLADFSNEALALYFNYQGGKFRDNIFAGDVGDPSRFVSDCNEALGQINQPTQRDAKVIRNTALIAHKKDRLPSIEGTQRSKQQSETAKKKRPIKNDNNKSLDEKISELARLHPDDKPSELWPHLKTLIESWSSSECKEVRPGIKQRDSWRYNFTRNDGTADSITYQSFRRKLKNGN